MIVNVIIPRLGGNILINADEDDDNDATAIMIPRVGESGEWHDSSRPHVFTQGSALSTNGISDDAKRFKIAPQIKSSPRDHHCQHPNKQQLRWS